MSEPLWMVRTSKNLFMGPMPRETLRARIQAGEFSVQDEVCPSLGYWFALHEAPEVRRQLDVVVPRARGTAGEDDDEVTQTETQTDAQPSTADLAIPDLPPLDGDLSPEEQATLATTRALREFRPPGARNGNGAAPATTEVLALGRSMERPFLWRVVVLGLVVAGVAILAAVFKALQAASSP